MIKRGHSSCCWEECSYVTNSAFGSLGKENTTTQPALVSSPAASSLMGAAWCRWPPLWWTLPSHWQVAPLSWGTMRWGPTSMNLVMSCIRFVHRWVIFYGKPISCFSKFFVSTAVRFLPNHVFSETEHVQEFVHRPSAKNGKCFLLCPVSHHIFTQRLIHRWKRFIDHHRMEKERRLLRKSYKYSVFTF